MTNRTCFFAQLFLLATSTASFSSDAFRTSQSLPIRVERIPQKEISERLGLKDNNEANGLPLSIGSGPNMAYSLMEEHEVVCPVSGSHQGILCTALLGGLNENDDAESIVNNHELVSQAILAGSLAASIRNSPKDGNSVYYLPCVITLVESLMADEIEGLDLNEMNTDKLDKRRSVVLYATNTEKDLVSATSDVYLIPSTMTGKVWRFSVDYKVATINLRSISSFGDRDSNTPLRPDVWLKNDSW